MLSILTDPKLIASAVALIVQAVGYFGYKADPVALTAAVSPLYLYVLAHAHAGSKSSSPAPAVASPDKAAS